MNPSCNYDRPRESTSGPARPDSQPGFDVVNVSAEGTPDARLQRPPRHSLRGPDGRMIKPGFGGYSAIDGSWMNERNCSVLHSPVARPEPMAADWSAGPTHAQRAHDYQCGGPGRCAYPSMCQGIQDGVGR